MGGGIFPISVSAKKMVNPVPVPESARATPQTQPNASPSAASESQEKVVSKLPIADSSEVSPPDQIADGCLHLAGRLRLRRKIAADSQGGVLCNLVTVQREVSTNPSDIPGVAFGEFRMPSIGGWSLEGGNNVRERLDAILQLVIFLSTFVTAFSVAAFSPLSPANRLNRLCSDWLMVPLQSC
jgi:hypothetical protein